MIQVTRLNGTQYFINAELILMVESTPDTIISMNGGIKVVVHESTEEIIHRIIEYRRKVYCELPVHEAEKTGNGE